MAKKRKIVPKEFKEFSEEIIHECEKVDFDFIREKTNLLIDHLNNENFNDGYKLLEELYLKTVNGNASENIKNKNLKKNALYIKQRLDFVVKLIDEWSVVKDIEENGKYHDVDILYKKLVRDHIRIACESEMTR